MKLVFAGTPAFAAAALAALLGSRHRVALVLTQPDRPAGRGLKAAASPVKALALEQGVPVFQPESLGAEAVLDQLKAVGADAMVVAAYGLILPAPVLALPRYGCINIHASLLPRWRGAAPIQRALLAGDRETGISIMQMDAGLDTGPVLIWRVIPIGHRDTAQTVHDRLAALGASCIVEALDALERGELRPQPQEGAGACYAPKITKAEAVIDWNAPAQQTARQVRAFNPVPGVSAKINGVAVKLWQASPVAEVRDLPGRVVRAGREGILVACGEGGLNIEVLQKAGGRRLAAAEFLAGFPLKPGEAFTA